MVHDHAHGLWLDDVTVKYSGQRHPALNALTVHVVEPATFLLGVNGAGKTTLFKTLLGELAPSSGQVKFNGRTLSANDGQAAVGYCPQDFYAPKHMTVGSYLQYLGWLKGLSKQEVKASVESCVELVGLSPRVDDKIGALSGGMLRRLGIAQALLGEPQLVLLDEPTASLDPVSRVTIRKVIAQLKTRSMVLVSTHLIEDVKSIQGSVIVLVDGGIAYSGHINAIPKAANNEESFASGTESAIVTLMEQGHV